MRVLKTLASGGSLWSSPVRYIISATPAGEPGDITLSASHASIGDQLTITGSGFGSSRGTNQVWFGELPQYTFSDDTICRPCTEEAASYVSWSNTEIVVTVPSMAPGLSGATGTYHPVYVEVGGTPTDRADFYIDPVTVIDGSHTSAVATVFDNSTYTVETLNYTNSTSPHTSQHDSYTTHVTVSTASTDGNYINLDVHDVLFKDCTFVATSPNVYYSSNGVISMSDSVYNVTFHNCVIVNNAGTGGGEGVNGFKNYHGSPLGRQGDWVFSDCSFGTPNSPDGAFSRGAFEIVEPTDGLWYTEWDGDEWVHTDPAEDEYHYRNIRITGCDFEPCGWHTGVSFAVYGHGPDRSSLIDDCTFKGVAEEVHISWNMVSGFEFSGVGLMVRDCEFWAAPLWANLEGDATDMAGGASLAGVDCHRLIRGCNFDQTHVFGTAPGNNAWDNEAFPMDHSEWMVFDDCDFNMGDATNVMKAFNYGGMLECYHIDMSTSYIHGYPNPATIWPYWYSWDNTDPETRYASTDVSWPTLGTRP